MRFEDEINRTIGICGFTSSFFTAAPSEPKLQSSVTDLMGGAQRHPSIAARNGDGFRGACHRARIARPVGSTHPTKCAISAAARVIASPGSGQRNPALLQR